MSDALPEFYFRIKDNGALVFRIDTENRQRRIELDQIAVVNVQNGNIRPQGDRVLSDRERQVIEDWRDDRRETLAAREVDDILRAVDHLNLTAQWAQSRASDDDLAAITDVLLLAMHDLRTVLVRKKSERLNRGAEE